MESHVRPYVPADLAAVKRLHDESGLDYQFPDLSSALFLVTKVVERDGQISAAAGARIEIELYLWMSHEIGTPEERWDDLQKLNTDIMLGLWLNGVDDCVARVPLAVEKSFAKRLIDLGFTRDREGWFTWSRLTNEEENQRKSDVGYRDASLVE